MSHTIRYENYRVVLTPRRLGDLGAVSMSDRMCCSNEEERQTLYRERCREIVEEVKRHVDNVGHAYVDFDTVKECSHCGANWTEKSDEYNGGCCAADQSAQERREPGSTA